MVAPQFEVSDVKPESGRAEVSAAIEKLAEEVARLARYVQLTLETTAGAGTVAAVGSISPTAEDRTRVPELALDIAWKHEAQASTLAELMGSEMSLQPDSRLDDTDKMEIVDGRTADDAVTEVGETLELTKRAGPRVENAIARSLADLRDRLGGFIKPGDN